MKRHALFVGVDQYADGHIPNLSCAVSDATDLHGFFKYGAGYDRVELLQNPAGKKEVLGAVREMTAGLGGGDFFLFFFAGHGFRVGENHVLVCAKDLYEDVKYEDDGLPLGQLKRRLSGAFDSALFLDACQSDILATRGGEGIAERDLSLIHETQKDEIRSGALTIVTSCDAGQTAAELSEVRHGLFTMAMLDLLKESQRAHTQIDLSDTFRRRLGRRMGEIATRSGLSAEQRPRFSCTGDSCVILLDGADATSNVSINSYHSDASSSYVICPICGKHNHITDTFRCGVCGRDYLCQNHYNGLKNSCVTCSSTLVNRYGGFESTGLKATEGRLGAAHQFGLNAPRKTGDVMAIELPDGAHMEFVYCGPGSFTMGGDSEKIHKVRLTKGFWLGKCEVTQGQWGSVMRNNPSIFRGDSLPVEHVSWNMCQEFISKLNLSVKYKVRLPWEAEWEYACRAGDMRRCVGSETLNAMAWYSANSGSKTHPVGQKLANAWGFYDMHGNVWEWCQDWRAEYHDGEIVDPTGPLAGSKKVLRGGSFECGDTACSAGSRYCCEPSCAVGVVGRSFDIEEYYGFRLCCSVDAVT